MLPIYELPVAVRIQLFDLDLRGTMEQLVREEQGHYDLLEGLKR